jgi:hypothetical protein
MTQGVVLFLSMTEEKKLSAGDLYKEFRKSLTSFKERNWNLAIFEGSPAEGLYSWCPDCIVASAHIRRFEEYQDQIQLLKFKVGTRKEWESRSKLNPFRINFPFVSDVPTAILFMGKLDVCRIIAPREEDLEFMCARAKIFQEQITAGDWNPPLKFRRVALRRPTL